MWVLPARGNPLKLAVFFDRGPITAPMVVVNDANDPQLPGYISVGLPDGVSRLVQPGGGTGTGDAFRCAYATLGTQPFWGVMTDDARPETDGWDEDLPAVAGDWGVTFPSDEPGICNYGYFPCAGGALVDAVGYLAHPSLMHLGIDNFWNHLARALGTLRPVPKHVIRRGPEVDRPAYARDREAWRQLRFGPAWAGIVESVRAKRLEVA